MTAGDSIFVGKGGGEAQVLLLKYANRHGLIAGATGTGKTVTLQVLAEGFSDAGVPVFCADVKGDLSGISQAGRRQRRRSPSAPSGWASRTTPAAAARRCSGTSSASRATRSAPPSPRWGRCCCRACWTSTTSQEGVLNIAFKVADDEGLLLLDLKDLRAMLGYVGENAAELAARSTATCRQASVGAIQRAAAGAGTAGRRRRSSASRRWTSPT